MKLLIAIPALNEEDAIESIISRSLAAAQTIKSESPVDQVEITVVSDGSSDKTVELANKYVPQINLIVFPQNRGYGAAIKEAWRQSNADLVGFLDADGTCDPNFFAPLCRTLVGENADVVLGCRLNKNSEMPGLRRVGNVIFATLLSVFSSSQVRDTASGMRVVRRSALNNLLPLPDGLHFTPAMSARALLSDVVKIVEIDMPYRERVGESKLRVGKDGVRFLKVITEAAFLYRPSRPFVLCAAFLFLVASLLMIKPIIFYLENGKVLEWMIYRFLVGALAGTASCLCFCASYLTGRITRIALSEEIEKQKTDLVARFFAGPAFWFAPGALTLIGGSLVLGSFLQLLETGQTYEHWSRFIVMSFCLSCAIILAVTRAIDFVLGLVQSRIDYWQEDVEHTADRLADRAVA